MEGMAPNSGPSFSDVPYDKRWELLKPYLEVLYLKEGRTVPEIVGIMKLRHSFYASEPQYKRRFGIWKLKKNISTAKKTTICGKLYTRAQSGKSSLVTYKDQDVDPRKFRRLVKTKKRQSVVMGTSMGPGSADIESFAGHALQCGNRIFMNWNMPHINPRVSRAGAYNHVSPFGLAASTPSDVVVKSPASANVGPSPRSAPSPRVAASPQNAPSPMTIAVRENIKLDRAHLFVHGRHMELLQGMSHEEKKIMTNWMHQFWLVSFKTAKSWGRGPRTWTSSMLGLDNQHDGAGSHLPHSPSHSSASPANSAANQQHIRQHVGANISKPTLLCQWSIHVPDVPYSRLPSPLPMAEEVDPNNEETWVPWPSDDRSVNHLTDTLQNHLECNDFSNIEVKDLPISATQVAKAAKRSREQLTEEALGFSIMGRNLDLVFNILESTDLERFSNSGLYPLHLAATYLDGGKTCCNVFNIIINNISVRKLYHNHLNHTVLDNLMISILKAHTSCLPSVVDDVFKKEPRFAGEEVDICGRWDADSQCIQALLANGIPTIPFEWKHMFCHTSVQVICHCITELFGPYWGPDINTPSGIFMKRCSNETCGQKLQLMPLHTLVIVAVHLASQGSSGETLFGMLACLLCLLKNGANPLLTAPISLGTLLGNEENQWCSHEEIDPFQLAQNVPNHLMSRWPDEVKTGWQVFCHVLKLSQAEWRPQPPRRAETNTSELRNEFIETNDDSEDGTDIDDTDIDDTVIDDTDIDDTDIDDTDIDDTDIDDTDSDTSSARYSLPTFCAECDECCYFGNGNLSALWAAVQTELVTYRRLQEGDPWISPNFEMESLLESLILGSDLKIGLIQKDMMKGYCICGKFTDADEVCARSEDVSEHYFSNMDDWNRSAFIETIDHESWHID